MYGEGISDNDENYEDRITCFVSYFYWQTKNISSQLYKITVEPLFNNLTAAWKTGLYKEFSSPGGKLPTAKGKHVSQQ